MKRFTETTKWDDPWFRKLPPAQKLLWLWLVDKCDNAGIIEVDIELASFQIGQKMPANWIDAFDGRLRKICGKKVIVTKFIHYQYGTLSKDCKAHSPVFQSLEKHGLKGYQYPLDTLQEKEEEKDTEQETESEQKKELKRHVVEEFQSEWNQSGFQQIAAISAGRLKSVNARFSEPFFQANWKEGIARVAKSDFCNGKNERNWRADPDWFLRPDTLPKILEGKYDNKTATQTVMIIE